MCRSESRTRSQLRAQAARALRQRPYEPDPSMVCNLTFALSDDEISEIHAERDAVRQALDDELDAMFAR